MDITTSLKAYDIFKEVLQNDVEEFWAMALSSTKNIVGLQMIFRGTVDSCMVHPRDIFRFAVRSNAAGLVVAHNHPSGDSRPSREDLNLTVRLSQVGKIIEIPIFDHLIVVNDGYTSFADEGLLI